MSAEPQIIKRVRSRASRIRAASPPATDAVDGSPSTTPDTLATKLKNKHKRSRPKSRLSFGTDDQSSDGDVFKVKKSNLSRKLVAPSLPEVSVPTDLDQASISTSPSYTKAYLDELKASTPSTPAVRASVRQTDSDMSFDASFDIDGAVVENASEVFCETAIPSASAISAAKEKRGRLRGTGTADDFISLSVTKPGDMPQGPHPESRLVREEDELGEGEDELAEYTGAQERIALGKKARKDEERKRRMGMVEMIEDAEDEDEETIEWEMAQIRRAGPDADREQELKAAKATYTPAPIPSVTPIPTLASSLGRLTSSLTTLTASHSSHTAALTTLADEQVALESKEAELRQMIEKAERKRSWFAAFRDWVESVAGFLDEKYPSLEKLEDEYVSLLTERYDMKSKRRRLDDEDDIASFLGVPPSAPPPDSVEETDELGRVVPSKNTTLALRTSRRLARSNRRLLRRARNQAAREEDDGHSTDGSLSPADADDFRAAMVQLDQRREGVLSDVRADDFRDPQLGLAKWFGEWRTLYEESYVGAWGGLGLVAAWEFWCRLEILGWDPIEDTTRDLDSFEWYAALHEYSRPREKPDVDKDEDDYEPNIGPGGDMVSSMISQAFIPRLSKLIEGGAFDPYSARHTRRMIDITEQVEASVEQEGVKFQALLKSASIAFREAVISTQTLLAQSLGLANPGAPFDPQSLDAWRRFLVRRLKLLTNLLKWRKYTGERFGIGEHARLLVRSCILPVAERGWEVGGEEMLRKVAENMPRELLPVEVTRRIP